MEIVLHINKHIVDHKKKLALYLQWNSLQLPKVYIKSYKLVFGGIRKYGRELDGVSFRT